MIKITLGDAIEIRIAPVTLYAVSSNLSPLAFKSDYSEEHKKNTNTNPLKVYMNLLFSFLLCFYLYKY